MAPRDSPTLEEILAVLKQQLAPMQEQLQLLAPIQEQLSVNAAEISSVQTEFINFKDLMDSNFVQVRTDLEAVRTARMPAAVQGGSDGLDPVASGSAIVPPEGGGVCFPPDLELVHLLNRNMWIPILLYQQL